jgi:hypothetical protein
MMGMFDKFQKWVDDGTDLGAENEQASQREERRADRIERVPGKSAQNEAARLRDEAANRRRGGR